VMYPYAARGTTSTLWSWSKQRSNPVSVAPPLHRIRDHALHSHIGPIARGSVSMHYWANDYS